MEAALLDSAALFLKALDETGAIAGLHALSAAERNRLHGLFQQATEGPCATTRPYFFEFANRAKYDAWKDFDGLSGSAAMNLYVESVVDCAMRIQSSCLLCLETDTKAHSIEREKIKDLLGHVEELKRDCARLWPQRFAHLCPPPNVFSDRVSARDAYYEEENEEVASFGDRRDQTFPTPMALAEEMGIPGKIADILSGHSRTESEPESSVSGENEDEAEDDPLQVKEPRILDPQSESLRKSPVPHELFEMIISSFRRIDLLEDAVQRLQLRIDAIQPPAGSSRWQGTTAVLLNMLKYALGVSGTAALIYMSLRAVQLRNRLK